MNVLVVLNYNDSSTVFDFMNKVGSYECIDKIVIVDNYSTDGSWKKLQALENEKIDVIRTEKNNGYACGNNFGVRYAEDNYPTITNIVISNPDIIVTEDGLKEVLNALNEGYGMATGVIYNYSPNSGERKLASNFAWKIPSYFDLLCNCFLLLYKFRRSILRNGIYLNYSKYKNLKYVEVEAVPGCFFAIKDSVFRSIDYFDEDTFLFGEETILGWKLRNIGAKVCVVNHVDVLHENSVSISKNIRKDTVKRQYRLDSELLYLSKYLKCSKGQCAFYAMMYKLGKKEQALCKAIRGKLFEKE